jgi:hypothetical protein
MIKLFLTIAIILLFSEGVYSQANSALKKPLADQAAQIDKIKKEIKANMKSYTKTIDISDSISYQYSYKMSKELKLISVGTVDRKQNLAKIVDWYFNNGQLIYTEQNYKERSSNKILETEKFYLNNENLFAWSQEGTWKDPNSAEFKQAATGLHAYAASLKRTLRNK